MKKIVAAAAAGLVLAGAAFADVSFNYTSSSYFTSNGGNLKYDSAARNECMSVVIQNEVAGAVVDMDLTTAGTSKDEYYGWMNFGIPTGNLQLTAGCWNGRYVNRVKNDAGDLDAKDFEYYKPGVINGSVGADSDNLTQGKISMFAAYTNTDLLPGTLMVKAGAVTSNWRPSAKSAKAAEKASDSATDSENIYSSGFAGEVAYRQDGLVNVNVAFKSHVKSNNSVAVFVSPLCFEKLTATVGATYATVQEFADKKWGRWGQEWGVDLRARYAVNEKLALTTMHNLSNGFTTPYTKDKDGKVTGKTENPNTMVMWNMLNVSYKENENLTFGVTGQNYTQVDTKHKFTGASVVATPYAQVKVSESAAVTASVRSEITGVNFKSSNEKLSVTVPVIVSFSL